MFVKLLARDIPEYRDVINEGIDNTIPAYQDKMKTDLYEQLLLGIAQCWILKENSHFEGVFITKIEEDTSCGGKKCTLVSGWAPGGMERKSQAVLAAWKVMSEYAKSEGCDRIAMFTDNKEVIKYLNMFKVLWATKYFEIELNREV